MAALDRAKAQQERADGLREQSLRLRESAAALNQESQRARELALETSYATSIWQADTARRRNDVFQFSILLDAQRPAEGLPDRRGFEWYILDETFRPPTDTWTTENSPIHCVRYSPDGSLLAAGGESGDLEIFDTSKGERTRHWPVGVTIRDIVFSSDARSVCATCEDGQLRLFSLADGGAQNFRVSDVPIWQAVFLAEDTQVAFRDQRGFVRFLDIGLAKVSEPLNSEEDDLNCFAVSPDQTWLIGGGVDADLHVWSLPDHHLIYEFKARGVAQMKCIAVSTDGHMVVTGGTDNLVRVARIQRPWSHEWILTGRQIDHPKSVGFASTNAMVAACDKNGVVRAWRLPADAMPEPRDSDWAWQAHRRRGYALDFQPDHLHVATGGSEAHVSVWHLEQMGAHQVFGQHQTEHTAVRTMTFLNNDRQLAVAKESGLEIWNVPEGTLSSKLTDDGLPRDLVSASPTGRYLAAGHDAKGLVDVWQRSKDAMEPIWNLTDQPSDALSFSPDEKELAIVDWTNGLIAIYDAASGALMQQIPALQSRDAEYSPDGNHLAFVEQDDVIVWDRKRQRPLYRLLGHASTVTSLAYSPDGRWLASGGRDRRVILWDAATGEKQHVMLGHESLILQVEFVGNERLVTLGEDGEMLVWHASLGTALCSLASTPGESPRQLAVSRNLDWIALRLEHSRFELRRLLKIQAKTY